MIGYGMGSMGRAPYYSPPYGYPPVGYGANYYGYPPNFYHRLLRRRLHRPSISSRR